MSETVVYHNEEKPSSFTRSSSQSFVANIGQMTKNKEQKQNQQATFEDLQIQEDNSFQN